MSAIKILTIAWKDTLLRFSDRSELLFFLVLPVVFTFILADGSTQAVDTTTDLIVVNLDQSPASAELLAYLSTAGTLNVFQLDAKQAQRQFSSQHAPVMLTIPSGLESGLVTGQPVEIILQKLPNNNQADAAERAIAAAMQSVSRPWQAAHLALAEAERRQPFGSLAERQAYFAASLEQARAAYDAAPDRILSTLPETINTREYDQGAQAATGQMVTWVFVPLLGISGYLAYERQIKTLPRLLTTPTSASTLLIGAILGQLGAGILQMVLLVGFGAYGMKINWGSSPSGLALMMVSFGLAAVAMGVMMSTFIKTTKQATNLSMLLGMVMALMGGCWWPTELFPPLARTISLALPTTWAMQGFTHLSMRGLGFTQVLLPAGVLLGFALVFFAIGIGRFRIDTR